MDHGTNSLCRSQLQKLNCYTVKPPKRGQFGTRGFVLSSEVVLSKRSTILYHIFCINVHIQGTTTSLQRLKKITNYHTNPKTALYS